MNDWTLPEKWCKELFETEHIVFLYPEDYDVKIHILSKDKYWILSDVSLRGIVHSKFEGIFAIFLESSTEMENTSSEVTDEIKTKMESSQSITYAGIDALHFQLILNNRHNRMNWFNHRVSKIAFVPGEVLIRLVAEKE